MYVSVCRKTAQIAERVTMCMHKNLNFDTDLNRVMILPCAAGIRRSDIFVQTLHGHEVLVDERDAGELRQTPPPTAVSAHLLRGAPTKTGSKSRSIALCTMERGVHACSACFMLCCLCTWCVCVYVPFFVSFRGPLSCHHTCSSIRIYLCRVLTIGTNSLFFFFFFFFAAL